MGKIREFTEEFVEINGISQYFLHFPSPQKEVIVHLHGGPGSSSVNFTHVFSPFLDFCNFVYYDQRGAGRTQKKNNANQEDLTIETLIEDLRQTIAYVKDKYKTDRVVLMGQSWGTVLGTQFALKYPKDIICYIGTGHVIDERREMKISYEKLKSCIESKGNKKDAKKLLAMKDYPYLKSDSKEYVSVGVKFFMLKTKHGLTLKPGKLLKTMFKSPFFKLSDLLLMMSAPKRNIRLTKWMTDLSIWDSTDYAVPIFYILGRDDWQTPSTLAADYFERINAPQKGLYWIENAGHATDVDNPADYFAAVKEILTHFLFTSVYESFILPT
ncbi:MAG: alpha/beta hydrolase [Defluviitaleaceae bacterium]|nr:alpha/beta hydrolase [Defluviitaleaceae bacterium]